MRYISGLLLFVLIFLAPVSVQAQSAASFQARAQSQAVVLSEQASSLIGRKSDFASIRKTLIETRGEARALISGIDDEITSVTDDLARLGESLDGEASRVTQQRDRLSSQLEDLKKIRVQVENNIQEADRIEAEISSIKRKRFYSGLTDREEPLVLPEVWSAGAQTFVAGLARFNQSFSDWFGSSDDAAKLNWTTGLVLMAAMLAAGVLAVPVRRWLNHRIIRPLGVAGQEATLGVLISLLRVVLRALPSVLVIFVLHQALNVLGFIPPVQQPLVQAMMVALVCMVFVESTCAIFLSYMRPMRPFMLTNAGLSSRLWFLFVFSAGIFATDHVLRETEAVFGNSEALDQIQRGLTAILLAGMVFLASRKLAWSDTRPAESEKQDAATRFGVFRTLLAALSVVITLAALVGYVKLAHFAATRIVLLSGLVLTLLILSALLKELNSWITGRLMKSPDTDEGQQLELVGFWTGFLVDIFVVSLGAPLVLLLLGLAWPDVSRLISSAVTGFQVGSLKISLVQIAFALAVFAVLLTLTRFIQRTTERRVFSHMRMDSGVQNSLKTLIGYVGLVIAFLTGIGMMGLDLSNLAIIAGALSVGIGFGLQSIVNNFVSGLILLFERPIKVGDWVVTASGEGIVKKISVRSTEIETFDRSSILVPNSELISSSVVNWTHKNKLGRVIVAVGVAYKEDPDAIIELLRTAAKSVDLVLTSPEPLIVFTGFGDSSLDFEVRAYIADIHNSLKAKSALRVEIFRIFRESGVEIPFPQRDLHIRDVHPDTLGALSRDNSV